MLSRVFKIDVLKCDCGGELRPLGALKDPGEIQRYLKHINEDHLPPTRGPPQYSQNFLEFSADHTKEEGPVIYLD